MTLLETYHDMDIDMDIATYWSANIKLAGPQDSFFSNGKKNKNLRRRTYCHSHWEKIRSHSLTTNKYILALTPARCRGSFFLHKKYKKK